MEATRARTIGRITATFDSLKVMARAWQNAFLGSLIWLEKSAHSKLMCANGYHWLLRDGQQVCWKQDQFDAFRSAALQFWQND